MLAMWESLAANKVPIIKPAARIEAATGLKRITTGVDFGVGERKPMNRERRNGYETPFTRI
jgi:hypothetical protein